MVTNNAAWVKGHHVHPYEVSAAPLTDPDAGQIVVKNHAIAINPIDWKLQAMDIHKGDIKYPAIFGEDVAGEVFSVGSSVTRFKKGDRVVGQAAGFLTKRNEEKAFQEYTILSEDLTVLIPGDLPYEKAVVFPCCFSTAAAGLFQEDYLNLQIPTEPAQKSIGKTVLVWGGASCVGTNAIQLAVAAGYRVITTASPKNFDLVKKLGASEVFDYKSPTVVEDLISAVKDTKVAGVYDAIGFGAFEATQAFIAKVDGEKRIATTVPGWPTPPEGTHIKHIFSLSIATNHVGKAVWVDYLTKAFASGSYVPGTEPYVYGKGVEKLQAAVDYLRDNPPSAQKVVVTL